MKNWIIFDASLISRAGNAGEDDFTSGVAPTEYPKVARVQSKRYEREMFRRLQKSRGFSEEIMKQ